MKAKSIDGTRCESDRSSSWCGLVIAGLMASEQQKLQMWNSILFCGKPDIIHKLTQLEQISS